MKYDKSKSISNLFLWRNFVKAKALSKMWFQVWKRSNNFHDEVSIIKLSCAQRRQKRRPDPDESWEEKGLKRFQCQ